MRGLLVLTLLLAPPACALSDWEAADLAPFLELPSAAAPRRAPAPVRPAQPTARDLEWVYRVAWGEIRSGDDFEVQTVCHIILNRLLQARWGDDLESVVTARRQFSALNEGDPNREPLLDPGIARRRSYRRVRSICALSLKGRLQGWMIDPTEGCDHYWHGAAVPYWAKGREPKLIGGTHCLGLRPVPPLAAREHFLRTGVIGP